MTRWSQHRNLLITCSAAPSRKCHLAEQIESNAVTGASFPKPGEGNIAAVTVFHSRIPLRILLGSAVNSIPSHRIPTSLKNCGGECSCGQVALTGSVSCQVFVKNLPKRIWVKPVREVQNCLEPPHFLIRHERQGIIQHINHARYESSSLYLGIAQIYFSCNSTLALDWAGNWRRRVALA
jgi:hypothetical protein